MASAAIFCPQSKAPGEQYLNQVHYYLCHNQRLEPLAKCVLSLKDVWYILANARQDIPSLGECPQGLQILSEWINTGQSFEIANCMSGVTSLPLLVVVQICQYFQYLEICGISHHECMAQLQTGGGVQGYCGGLLAAIAIACSRDEDEVIKNAATAMRIAIAIGICGELGDDTRMSGATTIVVRTHRMGQGDELVQQFPGSYISAITDPKTISIVGPVATLLCLQSHAREQGMLVQEMHIRGKVHNPENSDLVQGLCTLCDRTQILQLPHVSSLQAPVRSNKTGDIITKGSLTNELVSLILASRCEWYILLTKMATDLESSGRRVHTFATFGIGDCTPLSPFHKAQLRITKVDVQSLIAERGNESHACIPELGYIPPQNAIAIIGASCRLPGANNMEELWDLISSGQSRHVEVPTDRFDLQGSFRASQDRKSVESRRFFGNFIDQIDRFDHAFFHINPKEAANMDPQQRILLELSYQAMESSGYLASHKRESEDSVGCFIGASFAEYLDNTNAYPATAYTSTGTIRAFLCGRISHHFGWSGPSEVIDTACSSSLVAINRACKAVQGEECKMALAGGVNLITGINNFLDLSKAGFLGVGQCKPFDEAADGYCRSEGGGLVVLKPLSKALADSDHILGVIPGIATNQGGLSSSITIPHAPAQKKLYQSVLDQAAMQSDQVTYVEAHGTGTQAGDPVEMASIREVFGSPYRPDILTIGSLKGNIGHTETAAGVASLLKILAMINKTTIPPQASHKSLNQKIPALEVDKMRIASTLTHWRAPILAACVNSYGAAGSNCAMICCERPSQKAIVPTWVHRTEAKVFFPIIISAFSKESLDANMEILLRYLQNATTRPSLEDVAFTLSERRKIHRHRYVTSTFDVKNLAQMIESNARPTLDIPQTPKRVILAFGGQSKRDVGMDRNLYESHPRLKVYIDDCEKAMRSLGYPPLLPSLFQSEPIADLVTLHCGTFATQYAYAKCWIDAGLQVDAIIGHSFGELTGIIVSGVLSLRDGLKLIASRASLMANKWGQESGVMLAIHGTREAVQDVIAHINAELIEHKIEIACYNAPSSQVIVGSSLAINQTEQELRTNPRFTGLRSQRLDVARGFHSKFTEPILDDINNVSASLMYSTPGIPLEACTRDQLSHLSATRPSQHAREPVYFSDAIQRLEQRHGPCVWLEAGLGSPIIPMIKRALIRPGDHSFQAIQVPSSQKPTEVFSELIANFWREGIPVSYWDFLWVSGITSKQIWLPPYQFQPTTHWLKNVDRALEMKSYAETEKLGPILKVQEVKQPVRLVKLMKAAVDGPSKFSIGLETLRFSKIVSGHAVRQRPLCPASMYMECAAMALQLLQGPLEVGTFGFLNLSFQAPLGIDLEREASLTLEESSNPQEWIFSINTVSQVGSKSKIATHGRGIIIRNANTDFETYQRLIADRILGLENKSNAEKLMSKRAYGLFSQVVHYANFLQGISRITMDKNEAIASVQIPKEAEFGIDESTVVQYCDTVAIDTFIQVVGLLINSSSLVVDGEVFVATGVDRVLMSSACDFFRLKAFNVYAKYTSTGEGKAAGDIFVMTCEGTLAMMITGAQFKKLPIAKLEKLLDEANGQLPKETALHDRSRFEIPCETFDLSRPPPILQGIETSPKVDFRDLARSVEGDEERKTQLENTGNAKKKLQKIIAEYTGLAPADIIGEIHMGDIGVDSLAAVELAEELQTAFGKEISAEDVLISSYEGLSELLIPYQQVIDSSLPSENLSVDVLGFTPSSLSAPSSISSCISSISSGSSVNVNYGQEKFSLESLRGTSFQELSSLALTPKSIQKPAQQTKLNMTSWTKESNFTGGNHSKGIELMNPIEALTQCEAIFDQTASQHGFLDYWTKVAPKQDELLLAYICEAFECLGLHLENYTYQEPIPPLPYQAKHLQVVDRLLSILEKHNLLTRQGPDLVRGSRRTPIETAQRLHERFLEHFPLYAGEARLMALTGPKLADCLIGKADPLTLLFRGTAAQRVMEDYYCASPMLSTLTEQLVNFIGNVVISTNSRSGVTPVRILEVGAGFGGTTKRLAQSLEGSGVPISYTFSDISSSLVQGAKAKFSKFPWMDFQVLNLEKDMPHTLQNKYDIVIGTNCVHATTDKTKTISRIKSALNPQGFMVLSEVTQMVDWYNIVFGLLDGWWLAKDGSIYPLQPADKWMQCFQQAGFSNISYSHGQSPESNTQRLLVASNKHESVSAPVERSKMPKVQTEVYKEVDDVQIEADIYLPRQTSSQAMPIALMIHGGGYMTLSRKAIRPHQTSLLLAHNVLPVSIDYRLCPEIDLVDGPITDVCDAYIWAQTRLQSVVRSKGILIDEKNIVVIGWSSGGHLAMTTAWKAKEAGVTPPTAILSFYGPTDFEAEDLDDHQAELFPEQQLSVDEAISSLFVKPITSHTATSSSKETSYLGWLQGGDPRCELVLSLFKSSHSLPLLLNGIHPPNGRSWSAPPSADLIADISPISHVRRGTYTTPTFLIHGTHDEVVPYNTAVTFHHALQTMKIRSGVAGVEGAQHMHDLKLRPKDEGFWEGVEIGYAFLFKELEAVGSFAVPI